MQDGGENATQYLNKLWKLIHEPRGMGEVRAPTKCSKIPEKKAILEVALIAAQPQKPKSTICEYAAWKKKESWL